MTNRYMSLRVMKDNTTAFLTIPEIAKELAVSRERAYRMAAKGEIPTVRFSERRIRVPRAWLEDQVHRAMGEPLHEERGGGSDG